MYPTQHNNLKIGEEGENEVHIYTEYCSVIMKKEILSITGKWMELEYIMLSEESQTQKDKDHMFFLICGR
jgi:hypothetical protein